LVNQIVYGITECHSQECSPKSRSAGHLKEMNGCLAPKLNQSINKVNVKVPVLDCRGLEMIPVLHIQPAGDNMHSHEPSGGLSPPPIRLTATHMHSDKPGSRLTLPSTRLTLSAVGHHHREADTNFYCFLGNMNNASLFMEKSGQTPSPRTTTTLATAPVQ